MQAVATTKEEEELELLLTDNQQLQLLGQGTYGCAFYPEINCKTHHIVAGSSRNYLSKIQFQDESLTREIEIGQRIVKRVPNYRYYYAPIIESCPVQLANLRQNKIKQCNVLTKATLSNRPIMSSKVPYLGKLTLEKYFTSLFQKQHCTSKSANRRLLPPETSSSSEQQQCVTMTVTYIKKLVNSYLYLIPSFDTLNTKVGVVHLDVKGDNIMYDTKHHLPILIDFGMSYCIEWLQLPAYLSFKYPFGVESFSYSPWCIEVSLLTHLARYLRPKQQSQTINRHGGYVDETLLKSTTPPELLQTFTSLCADFVKSNINSRHVFTDAERHTLQSNLQNWIVGLAQHKTLESLWTSLLASYRTWDLYAVAMMYLYEMEDSGLLLIYPSGSTDLQATPVRQFLNQLKHVILATPDQRPTGKQMVQDARALFTKMTLTNYLQITSANLQARKKARRILLLTT